MINFTAGGFAETSAIQRDRERDKQAPVKRIEELTPPIASPKNVTEHCRRRRARINRGRGGRWQALDPTSIEDDQPGHFHAPGLYKHLHHSDVLFREADRIDLCQASHACCRESGLFLQPGLDLASDGSYILALLGQGLVLPYGRRCVGRVSPFFQAVFRFAAKRWRSTTIGSSSFACRPRRSIRRPSSSWAARIPANSSTGSAFSIIARSRSLSSSVTPGCARTRATGGTGG